MCLTQILLAAVPAVLVNGNRQTQAVVPDRRLQSWPFAVSYTLCPCDLHACVHAQLSDSL